MSRLLKLVAAIAAAVSIYIGLVFFATANQRAMVLPVDSAPLVAEASNGARSFTIEIADDDSERSAGLMFREAMEDGHGMLFVFDDTRQVGFWMKNTPMPLDLLFIGDDGVVKAIMPGVPFSEAPIAPGMPVRFVLELKSGMAEKNGISVGDRVRHPAVDAVAGGR